MQKSVVIIGSGCAGFAVADRLLKAGINDIVLLTEGVNCGTSRNTGSDKQTYYKASTLCGEDSILAMATTLYDGGGMDGNKAIIEATNSLRCFFNLVEYGVNFPMAVSGEYVGYKTDHDDNMRATSVGPLTSKIMTEVLEKNAILKGLQIIDNALVVKLDVQGNAVRGLIYLDLQTNEVKYIATNCIVLAVGGSSGIYGNSVYPHSQHGGLSLAFDVGVESENLTEWQYGIASKDFRWNLSGSYQQVMPAYYSVDSNGHKHYFLEECLGAEAGTEIFKKGYEWPFDSKKMLQSSRIDLLVLAEEAMGREVYIDFTEERNYLLSTEAKDYLENAGATGKTPIERLCKLNPKAIELYASHNIFLSKKPLKIGVCAQHCNGGIKVDDNCQTSVTGLFAIGEASGNFGVYRAGGTALNSTQVGALRVANYLQKNASKLFANIGSINNQMLQDMQEYIQIIIGEDNVTYYEHKLQKIFDENCGIKRNLNFLQYYVKELKQMIANNVIKIGSKQNLFKYFRLLDIVKTQIVMSNAVLAGGEKFGSRGGSIYCKDGKELEAHTDWAEYVVVANYEKGYCRNRIPFEVKNYNFEKLLRGKT